MAHNRNRWFVSAYLFVYLFAPVLNAFVEKVKGKGLGKWLLVFYIFTTLYGWLMLGYEFGQGMSAVSLIGLYMLGRWLRISDADILKWSKWKDLGIYSLCVVTLMAMRVSGLAVGFTPSPYGYLNPVVIVESVFLFQFFRKLEIRPNKLVNWISASAFAAYLFHRDYSIGSNFEYYLTVIKDTADWPLLASIGFILGVFGTAIVVDQIRIGIFRVLTFAVKELRKQNSGLIRILSK